MRTTGLLTSLALALTMCAAPQADATSNDDGAIAARVDHVLSQTPVIDGHNDLPWEIREQFDGLDNIDLDADTSALQNPAGDKVSLMTDIPRLRAGHVGAQFWSVWIPPSVPGAKAVQMTLEQIDLVHNMVARYPDTFAMASSAADIRRIEKSGRIASLIGVEGGNQMNNSLAVLRDYYRLGVRYMTLTHWENTAWADSANQAPEHHGLTDFGRKVVHEMNRMGMLVDLSHVSADTMRDAIEASRAPVMFSHSGARALDDHPRDVPDDVLRMVRANHGIVMVNFYPPFLSRQVHQWVARQAGVEARLKARYLGQPKRVAEALKAWQDKHPRPAATISQVADHVEHIRKLAGPHSVGIGSDFDGIGYTPEGLDGVDKYPALFEELARRGWSDDELADLAGNNLLRVLEQAEQVAEKLQAKETPSHAKLDGAAAP